MTGRPTTYTRELGDKICELIADGMTLRKIAELDHMPQKSTILLWVVKGFRGDETYKAFSDQYACAREAQSEVFMDEVVEIADGDKTEREGEGAKGKVFDTTPRDRLRCEMRLRAAEKFASKRYGAKPDASVTVNLNQPLDEEDRALLSAYADGKKAD